MTMTAEQRLTAEQLEGIQSRADAATPGPWAWAQTTEKGYGANVGAGCYADNDYNCERPLVGDLSDRADDYYVDQPIAELGHQSANADAEFIAHARSDIPALLAELRAGRRERDEARKVTDAMVQRHARQLALAIHAKPWNALHADTRDALRNVSRAALDAAMAKDGAV